jgi:hypothetical protein
VQQEEVHACQYKRRRIHACQRLANPFKPAKNVRVKKSQKKVEWSYGATLHSTFLGFFFSTKTFFRVFRCATGFGIVVTRKIGNPPIIEKVFVAKTARKRGKTAKNGKKCPCTL